MLQIKVDNRSEGELASVYKFLTGMEGKNVVDFLKNDLKNGDIFESIKKWLENTIYESNESKFQRKIIDILCDYNVISNLPSDIKAYIKEVVTRVNKNQSNFLERTTNINDTEKKLDKFINQTSVLRNKFQELDSLGIFKNNRLVEANDINLEMGVNATNIILFACIVLVAFHYTGIL